MESSVLSACPPSSANARTGRTAGVVVWARVLSFMSFSLSVIGCSPAVTATPLPTLVPQRTGPVEANNVQASANVVPAKEVYLSFVISGPVDEVYVEKGDQVEAGQILATLQSTDLEYSILQAEAAVRASELDYEYWKLPRRLGGEVVERGPLAEKELEQMRRALETAQAELSQTELIAPFAATVVTIEVKPGEFVQSGQNIIVLARLDSLLIETSDLSELNVARVKIGQPATIYVDALNKEFEGAVTAISPIADTLGSEVVFKVTVQLEEQSPDLLWGMSADVEIEAE